MQTRQLLSERVLDSIGKHIAQTGMFSGGSAFIFSLYGQVAMSELVTIATVIDHSLHVVFGQSATNYM